MMNHRGAHASAEAESNEALVNLNARVPRHLWRRVRLQCLREDRKSTRLNSSHVRISYAVFCLKKKNEHDRQVRFRLHPDLHSHHGLPGFHAYGHIDLTSSTRA